MICEKKKNERILLRHALRFIKNDFKHIKSYLLQQLYALQKHENINNFLIDFLTSVWIPFKIILLEKYKFI